MADHAARAGGGMKRKRVGRAPEHRFGVGALHLTREQMLLQKVVRPAKASGPRGYQDLRAVQRFDGGTHLNLERLQKRTQADEWNVTTEGCGGVRGAT